MGLATAGFAGAAFGFAATLTGALGLGAAFFWTTGLLTSFLAGLGATFFAGLSAGEDFTTFFTTGFFLGTTFFAGFLLPAALPLFFGAGFFFMADLAADFFLAMVITRVLE